MSYLFNNFIYRPLINLIIWLYNTVAFHDLGIAIIIATVIVRFLLFPMYQKMMKYQAIQKKMQPELAKIQKEMKGNYEAQGTALMAVYKKYHMSPFASLYSILLIIIQLPIFLALFKIFTVGLQKDLSPFLYNFVANPGVLNHTFLGLINLNEKSMVLTGIVALAQFVQIKLSTPKSGPDDVIKMPSGTIMGFILAGMTVLVLANLPAAAGIYWLVTTVFSVVQQKTSEITLSKNEEFKGDNAEPNKLP